MNNLVSIITPSYNSERFISETINSVLSQTYQNWEMIIVDDFSTDNSQKIIAKYLKKDNRIKYFGLEENSGAAVARNTGINKAEGRYIAFLDSDDLWKANKLEVQLAFMKQKKISFSYSSYELMDEEGNSLNLYRTPPDTLTYKELLKENVIGCLTAVYDTNILGKVYMPLIRKRQDFGLWLSILKRVPKAFKVPEILAQYRILNQSISSNKVGLLKYNFELFYKHEKLSFLKSIYYVGWNIYRRLFK